MEPREVVRIGEIDRTERIRAGYVWTGGELRRLDVNWDSPAWKPEGQGEHSVAAMVAFCRDHLDRNGRMAGAFDGHKLVGVAIIQHNVRPGTAQLAFLHVSNGCRRMGIGGRLTEMLLNDAQQAGARKIVVSATPSASAVNFYLSHGFQPTSCPLPELYELEPDDIHMIQYTVTSNQ